MTNTAWQRPFTAKRYLHPPLAENLITMWPDFRIMLGDIEEKMSGFYSTAFRILIGPEFESPEFEKTRYYVREDGVPIHSISSDMGDYELSMESLCDIRRVPAAYSRVVVYNKNAWRVSGEFAVMARTGDERHLTGMEVDGYAHFTGEVRNWGFLENTFSFQNDLLSDGRCGIKFKYLERFNPVWQEDVRGLPWHLRYILRLSFTLEPGEKLSFDVMFRRGETCDFDYDAEKRKTEGFWLGELGKIQSRPDTDNQVEKNIINSLVSQCLQMFCCPVGKDYVYPRQGGLQRAIWPMEAIEFLIALDRMGGYFDYTDKAYSLFFDVMQEKSGDDAGMVKNFPGQAEWACNTAGALWGLSRHLIFKKDPLSFARYRENMLLAFNWIEKKRNHNIKGAINGIFPPMKSTDWDWNLNENECLQCWCITDTAALAAYRWLHNLLVKYDDPEASKVGAAYEGYIDCMRKILAEEMAAGCREDELLISNRAGLIMPDPPKGPYMSDGPAFLLRAGVIEPDSEAARLCENYFRNHGLMKNGLTGLMNDGLIKQGHPADQWAGHTWYTSFPDICWFAHWLRRGERGKAYETLTAQFKYAMTPEYYMNERYADNDPYFAPWLPNASASGRLIMMLYAWYNGETDA